MVLDENLRVPWHLIDFQLTYAVRDANDRGYKRTARFKERRKMAQ